MAFLERITSRKNHLIERWKKLGTSRAFRRKEHAVIVEGKNLILDMLHSPHIEMVNALILSETASKRYMPANPSFSVYIIPDDLFSSISTVENPEGFLLELRPDMFEMTVQEYIQSKAENGHERKMVIFDSLQDPGNVGTLMRTAALFSVDALLLIEPVCDVWNPKVVRSAKGAHLQLKIISSSWEEVRKFSSDLPHLFVTFAPTSEAIPINQLERRGTIDLKKGWAIVLGNEGNGVTLPEDLDHTKITIPTNSRIESLNVAQAGAICLYAFSTIGKE